MSKLQELIKELCPDGVEFKKLEEVCELSRGKVYSKTYINNNIGIILYILLKLLIMVN